MHYVLVATRHLKPPNRKKHEEDIEKLNLLLREKDDELVSFYWVVFKFE